MSIPGSASPLFFQTAAAAAAFSVNRSLRFNSADSAYLNKTFSSAGNRKTYTISFWVKSSNHDDGASVGFGGGQIFSAGTSGSGARTSIGFPGSSGGSNQDKFVVAHNATGSTWATLSSNAVFKDFSAWQHFVVAVDCTQGTASDRVKVYVNGSQITMSGTYPSNEDQPFNNNVGHAIGRYNAEGKDYFNGYIAEFNFIDGSQLAATDFGEYDDNNNWNPKEFTGTYGSNGFRLNFSDATSTTTIAEDSSGNNNDFTANNISVTAGSGNDSMFDAPVNGSQSDTGAGGEVSGNYCTMNPLALSDSSSNASVSLANGNLEVRNARTNYWGTALSTFSLSSGKWYFEASCIGSISWSVGIYGVDPIASRFYTDDEAIGYSATGYEYKHTGVKQNNLSSSSYGASYSGGDVIGVALDLDNGTLTFYKNGTSQGTAFSSLSGRFALAVSCSGANSGWNLNFGQRAFTYQSAGTNRPADTFKAVCTANLSDPTIADGSTAMDVALYTGTGNSGQTVSGLNFSPDLVWFKSRSAAQNHAVFDTVRGVEKRLHPNLTQAQDDSSTGLTAFNSDGFTFGSNNVNGASSTTYAAWAWDGGTSTTSNTDGSITSNVRANASAGFSIVEYTGNATNSTVGHGLNAAPELIIIKLREDASGWAVYHDAIGTSTSNYIELQSTSVAAQDNTAFQNTAPTSSVFSIGTKAAVNNSGDSHIALCFAPVEGYSAFGSYTGTANLFIYTGFKPQWLMLKSYAGDGFNWVIIDDARGADSSNVSNKLYPNLSGAEDSDARGTETKVVFLSNGFLFLDSGAETNDSTRSYIYGAFASHPFKTSRGGFQNIP